MAHFHDRRQAGRTLAKRLEGYRAGSRLVVLGLPRGGVPVAAEVARELHAPLDVLVVRKVGVPTHPELAMGAVAAVGGRVETVRNTHVMEEVRDRGGDGAAFEDAAAQERDELARREQAYRNGRSPLDISGLTVIVVDDGLATGATMRAAVTAARQQAPARLLVGAPVGSREVCDELAQVADAVVCVITPEPFHAVGQFYQDFSPTTDEEVRLALADSA